MSKVHLPKGMRDFLPARMHNRRRVIETVRAVFERFGFEPLETPALERIETLLGKSGEEADRLIFRVLKRGEGGRRGEVDLALRYDLTVPLARVVAMHPELPMPFKRYQVQPVWRADRPQRGRFREFYQCDVDIVGTASPLAEAECLAVVATALDALGFEDFRIRLNDRRLLRRLAEAAGVAERETELLVAIDKLDKVGEDGVRAELAGRGFDSSAVDAVFAMLHGGELPGAGPIEAALREIADAAVLLGVPEGRLVLDRTLARGLDYYTGPVFETVLDARDAEGRPVRVGSVSGGGRYDGLVGIFSGREIPAVGVSLGLERLIVVMEELGMLPEPGPVARVLVTVFSPELRPASLEAVRAFREAGVPAELSFAEGKLGKQFKAAARRGLPWVLTIGPDEREAGVVRLKNLGTGEQVALPLPEAVARVAGA